MKILVTGSSGFLAQHIIPAFMRYGHEIVAVDKRPNNFYWDETRGIKFIQCDINDLTFRDVMGVDAIVHLAWRTNIPDCVRHPKESTYQNIDTTIHMLELAKEAGVKKFFFPSTASLYGNNQTPWTEEMLGMPIEHYSWQKLACEFACKMYSQSYGVNTAIARFFQVFGEHQRDDTALAAFLRFRKAGKPVTLTETHAQSSFKSGQRDFIYAGDLAEAVVLLTTGEAGGGEIYNVATGECKTMEQIAEAMGAEVKWIPRRDWEVERHQGDISKLKALGWQPKVDVLEWIKTQI